MPISSTPSPRWLKGANFVEVPHAEIDRAPPRARRAARRAEGTAGRLSRGAVLPPRAHRETSLSSTGFGCASVPSRPWSTTTSCCSWRSSRRRRSPQSAERRRWRTAMSGPGSVLIKYFRNIATTDLIALYPKRPRGDEHVRQARPPACPHSRRCTDRSQLTSTLTVLFLVSASYLGVAGVGRGRRRQEGLRRDDPGSPRSAASVMPGNG